MAKKITIQFFSKKEEVFLLLEKISSKLSADMFAEIEGEYLKINSIPKARLNTINEIFVGDFNKCHLSEDYYSKFENFIVLNLGDNNKDSIFESVFHYSGDNADLQNDAKTLSSQIKKSTHCGLFFKNPNTGDEHYYKTARYTAGAAEEQKRGLYLRPIAGNAIGRVP